MITGEEMLALNTSRQSVASTWDAELVAASTISSIAVAGNRTWFCTCAQLQQGCLRHVVMLQGCVIQIGDAQVPGEQPCGRASMPAMPCWS